MKIKDYKLIIIDIDNDGHATSPVRDVNIREAGYLPKEFVELMQQDQKNYRTADLVKDAVNKMPLLETLNNVETLYRLPKISLSRDKVKLWGDKNNAKVIRDSKKADVKIFSIKSISSLIEERWNMSFITKENYLNFLFNGQRLSEIIKKDFWDDVVNKITDLDDDVIILKMQGYHYTDADDTQWTQDFIKWNRRMSDVAIETWCQSFIPLEKWETWVGTRSGNFMLDSVANKLMSSDSVTFDDEMYLNVKNMIKSGNDDDITVAMTTIANCNIEESRTYLALLFFHYNEGYFKSVDFYSSVSFKAVRNDFQKYADLTYGHSSVSVYDTLINHLIDDEALTVNAMEHLLDLVFENVILRSTGMVSSKSFIIKRSSISLTPEASEKVNKRPNKDITREILNTQKETFDLPF